MNNLFWKIFVSFWLALLLFAGTTIWITSAYLENVRSEQNVAGFHQRLRTYTVEAREILARKDMPALKKWLLKLDRYEAIPILLVDETGSDLLGRPVPARFLHRMRQVDRGFRGHFKGHELRQRRMPRDLILAPDGTRYRLIPDFRSITLGRVLKRPHIIAIPVVVATVVGGLVCLLLARYLTAPLGRLKQATERMAAGDLSHRVTPTLRGRKDEIADLAEGFDHMAERLEQLVASHKQLLRDASHELRSPLARLQVALGLTRQRADASLEVELDRIERETERLNELIGQLLSLARLESGGTAPMKNEIDVAMLLKVVVDDAAYEARADNKEVTLVTADSAFVSGDEVLLHSAIENIVRNAIRYTDVETRVKITLRHDGGSPVCLISVCDRGPGVPEDMLPRLFDPFVRVDPARDRESGGYGLGLAIAQRAIQLHQGSITAANREGGGIRMDITLPVSVTA